DWNDVSLAFCTGLPDTRSKPPLMAPFRVSADGDGSDVSDDPRSSLWNPTTSALSSPFEETFSTQREIRLNENAGRRQISEINQMRGVQRVLAEDSQSSSIEETYPVGSKLTLADGPDDFSVNVFSIDLTGEIYRVATPLISSYAYRQVTLMNPIDRALVSAKASVFLNGDRVGRMEFPATPAGGTFQVGLGADRSVRTRRQLLRKEEAVQGGNRVITLDYRLVVSNYYEDDTDVRLFDRMPLPQNQDQIQVALESEREAALSNDPVYRRIDFPVGILRWDIQVPKQRFGSNAFDFDYQLKLELDRNQSIINVEEMSQLKTDLDFKRSGGAMGGMGGGIF
ncbi:MAG: DUF4139 domain-containing protein, partial [Planctomycetota bacterium]